MQLLPMGGAALFVLGLFRYRKGIFEEIANDDR